MVCLDCPRCKGLAPLENPQSKTEYDAADVSELVDQIADIIECENAGSKTDWSFYSFEIFELVKTWREAENQVQQIHASRFQSFLRGWIE